MVEHTPSIHEDLGPIPSITNINDRYNNNKLQKMHVFGIIVLEGYKRHGTGSGQAQKAVPHNDGRKSVSAGVWGVYFRPCPYKAT